jgi:hypothetical protein
MTSRWTEDDLAKFQKNSGRAGVAPGLGKSKLVPRRVAKPSKFKNVRTSVDGILFDSKLEARRYGELKILKATNHIEWFLMQVPIHCGGGVFYKVDFQIKWRTTLLVEPRVTFEDCTGADMQRKTNKLKQVKAMWGIDVELLRGASK